jgi:hypothetical protein
VFRGEKSANEYQQLNQACAREQTRRNRSGARIGRQTGKVPVLSVGQAGFASNKKLQRRGLRGRTIILPPQSGLFPVVSVSHCGAFENLGSALLFFLAHFPILINDSVNLSHGFFGLGNGFLSLRNDFRSLRNGFFSAVHLVCWNSTARSTNRWPIQNIKHYIRAIRRNLHPNLLFLFLACINF